MRKGVLEVGTIFVILNIIVATVGVMSVEFLLGQYKLQQKLVLLDQNIRIKCSSVIKETANQEYSKKEGIIDSLATMQIKDFFGTPKNTVTKIGNNEIITCEGGLENCDIDFLNEPIKLSCNIQNYHPNGPEKVAIVLK